MKDDQVDLCGQIGAAEDETFPVLTEADSFSFACDGCGDCCRGREDIVLSGYDLWRLSARLRLPPALVIRSFCRRYVGTASHMPVVRLRPLKNEKNNCPFLYQGHCAVHDAEPLVCALYPLGQQIDLDGTVTYFAQPTDCGGQVHQARVADYLDRYGIRERVPLDVQWAMNCIRLSKMLRRMEGTLSTAVMQLARRRVYRALYLDYDPQQPYAPQFTANLARLDAELARLERENAAPDRVKPHPVCADKQ